MRKNLEGSRGVGVTGVGIVQSLNRKKAVCFRVLDSKISWLIRRKEDLGRGRRQSEQDGLVLNVDLLRILVVRQEWRESGGGGRVRSEQVVFESSLGEVGFVFQT